MKKGMGMLMDKKKDKKKNKKKDKKKEKDLGEGSFE